MKDNHPLKKQSQFLKDPKWLILFFAIIILIVVVLLFYLNSNQESPSQPKIDSTEIETETEPQSTDSTETKTETSAESHDTGVIETETETEISVESHNTDNTEPEPGPEAPSETETETWIKYQNYILGDKEYALEIADDADEHIKGLSGRTQLPAGQGMLFIFPTSGNYGIWMKEMNFAIDIIWLDAERRIVGLKENAQPASYPEIFYGEENSLYVIEINANEIADMGLQIGDQVFLNDGN